MYTKCRSMSKILTAFFFFFFNPGSNAVVLNTTTFILLSIADTLHQNALDYVKNVFNITSVFVLNLWKSTEKSNKSLSDVKSSQCNFLFSDISSHFWCSYWSAILSMRLFFYKYECVYIYGIWPCKPVQSINHFHRASRFLLKWRRGVPPV